MDVGDRAESNPTWWDLGPQHRHRPGKPMAGLQPPASQAEATWLADAGIPSQTGSEHVSAQAPLRSSNRRAMGDSVAVPVTTPGALRWAPTIRPHFKQRPVSFSQQTRQTVPPFTLVFRQGRCVSRS